MQMIQTKKDITEKIGELRKHGYLVYTFQNNRKMRIPIAGVTDYLVVGCGLVAFIESKLISTKDKLNEKQIEFKEKIEEAEKAGNNFNVKYIIVNENNINETVDKLINLAYLFYDCRLHD